MVHTGHDKAASAATPRIFFNMLLAHVDVRTPYAIRSARGDAAVLQPVLVLPFDSFLIH
jgi:hypothetical protein